MKDRSIKPQSTARTLIEEQLCQSDAGCLVIALPSAKNLPVHNVKTYDRLPCGVISLTRFRELHSVFLADLKRKRDMQVLREKLRMGSEPIPWICEQMTKLNATAEEYVWLLER